MNGGLRCAWNRNPCTVHAFDKKPMISREPQPLPEAGERAWLLLTSACLISRAPSAALVLLELGVQCDEAPNRDYIASQPTDSCNAIDRKVCHCTVLRPTKAQPYSMGASPRSPTGQPYGLKPNRISISQQLGGILEIGRCQLIEQMNQVD